jgi:hypothetical protein
LRERKYEVQRFESQMVALGSFEYQIFEENNRREEERERERCKVIDIGVRVLR